MEPASPPAEAPDALADRRAAHAALRETLAEFDNEERFLIRIYFLEDATAADVGRLTGLGGANQVYEKIRGLMRRLRSTVEQNGLHATFGTFGNDFDGEYFEGGYSLSVGDLDLSATWIYSTEDLIGADDHTLVFGISHTFDIDID